MPVFSKPIGIPYADMDLKTMKRVCPMCGKQMSDGRYARHYETQHATSSRFTPEVALTICKVINSFGCGQHPVACAQTVDYFAADYMRECLAKAQRATTDTSANALLNAATAAL